MDPSVLESVAGGRSVVPVPLRRPVVVHVRVEPEARYRGRRMFQSAGRALCILMVVPRLRFYMPAPDTLPLNANTVRCVGELLLFEFVETHLPELIAGVFDVFIARGHRVSDV